MEILYFALTLLCSLGLGLVFGKLKLPAGLLVGGIIGAALLNITLGIAYVPIGAKTIAQITAGAFIGSSVDRQDLQHLRNIGKPATILFSSYLAANIIMGFVIFWISPLDLATSLFSAVPGGMSDIPLIAADMGADAPKVATMQFIRMLLGVGVFPGLISMICRNEEALEIIIEEKDGQKPPEVKTAQALFVTLGVALASGGIGALLKIPAGALLFSLLGIIALKLLWGKIYLPKWIKRFAQVMSGSYIGFSVGIQDLLEMRNLIFPVVIITLGYSAFCFLIGAVLRRTCGMGRKESMLACTPAGASDMALISMDMGVQSADLVVLQVMRLLVVSALFPQVIGLILWLFK